MRRDVTRPMVLEFNSIYSKPRDANNYQTWNDLTRANVGPAFLRNHRPVLYFLTGEMLFAFEMLWPFRLCTHRWQFLWLSWIRRWRFWLGHTAVETYTHTHTHARARGRNISKFLQRTTRVLRCLPRFPFNSPNVAPNKLYYSFFFVKFLKF